MEFEQIVMARYATKSFHDKKVPVDKIHKLKEIIRFAPSSYNIQPWKIKIIEDKETKEKLAPASWNQPQITSCSHLFVFCANADILGNIEKLQATMLEANVNKAVVDEMGRMMKGLEKNLNPEQKLSWAQRQTYIALANAVNGAKSLGLDSCPMEGFDPKKYSEILGLPKNLVPTALVAIGYASDTPRKKLRFPEKEVFF